MKVEVNIYQEKSMGAPLRTLIEPIVGEAENYDQISELIVSALSNASSFINSQEIITQVETMGIHRYLDIVNLQVYLRNQGLVLVVSEISTDPVKVDFEKYFIKVLSPNLGMLPSSTTFYQTDGEYDLLSIISEIVDKYNLGDTGIVPESNIKSLVEGYNNMKSNGMPIFSLYLDSLQNELMNYGFQMFYVFNS